MGFASLALHNFRSYSRYAVALGDGVNIIVGPNGSGKTNLLEAIYVLSTGGTFRGSERDLVAHSSDWFRLEGVWDDQQRIMTYQTLSAQKAEKQFNIDGAKKVRLTHSQRVPVVLFEPDHLRLLTDSPSARRNYLDGLLISLQSDYSWLKHQFERVLLQRNNLLKSRLAPGALDDSLFVWDIKFAELASNVVGRRRDLVEAISSRLSDLYSDIARKKSVVEMHYVSSIPAENYQAQVLHSLQRRRSDDMIRGFTTVGPQRDDFKLILNGSPAEASASRGETRTLLLALKIVEFELISKQSGHQPLLLLDDVFSELDASRRQALAGLTKSCQTIITTTDADAISGLSAKAVVIRTT
jgi:DNA replication and repair protein RecF